MLSLVYRCLTFVPPSEAFALSLIPRYFSITHRRLDASSAPSETSSVEDAKPHKDPNLARRLRYANDPEYRAKEIARVSARHRHLYAIDPEYRAKHNARTSAIHNARYRSDAQVREHRAAEHAAWKAKKDPVAWEEYLQRTRVSNRQRYVHDFTFKQRQRLSVWIRSHIRTRELTWRTHDAELHANRVAHLCSGKGCGFEKKLKLWMKRKDSDPALYDCYSCFTSDWVPEKVLPIGYEHVVYGSGEKTEPRPVSLDAAGNDA